MTVDMSKLRRFVCRYQPPPPAPAPDIAQVSSGKHRTLRTAVTVEVPCFCERIEISELKTAFAIAEVVERMSPACFLSAQHGVSCLLAALHAVAVAS